MKRIGKDGFWMAAVLVVLLATLALLFSPAARADGLRNSLFDQQIVNQDLTVAAGETLNDNVAIFNGNVKVEQGGYINGNLSIFSGDLVLEGKIDGNLAIFGGDAYLAASSHVSGDVSVLGGKMKREANAYIGGHFIGNRDDALSQTDRTSDEIQAQIDDVLSQIDVPSDEIQAQIDDALSQIDVTSDEIQAQIDDVLSQIDVTSDEIQAQIATVERMQRNPLHWFLRFLGRLFQALLWTLLITALVLLIVWLFPKQIEQITDTAQTATGLSFATGAIVVLGLALSAALFTITLCFALLAFPILAILALVMLFGWAVTSCWLGQRLDQFLAGQANFSWHPLISVAISALFLSAITTLSWSIVACLGFIIILLLGSTGSGAVIVHLARSSGRGPDVLTGGADAPTP